MKVLMAARYPVGGIRTFLRYVYSQPVFGDCTITLLAPGDDLGDFLAKYISTARMQVRTVSGDSKALFSSVRGALRKEKFDLLHSHGLTTGVVAEIARTGQGVPHLMTMHDVFLPRTFLGFRGRMQQIGLSLAMRRCDAIHAVSNDCAGNVTEYLPLVRKERVHPILNGIDTETILNAVPIDAHTTLGVPLGTRLVGFFGRFMAQKGFRTLVDAVEMMARNLAVPPFRVVTFGWGGYIREDFQYLKNKGLDRYFIQQPHTDEPYRWMKAMDVVVMPSRWEACPLQPMEALAAGVPFIGTSCIGLGEVMEGTPSYVVDPESADQLAETLARVLISEERAPFDAYARIAKDRFSVAETAFRLRALYGQLVDARQ